MSKYESAQKSYSVHQQNWSHVLSETSTPVEGPVNRIRTFGRGSACLGSASLGFCVCVYKSTEEEQRPHPTTSPNRPERCQVRCFSGRLHLVSGLTTEQITGLLHPAHSSYFFCCLFVCCFSISPSCSILFLSYPTPTLPALRLFLVSVGFDPAATAVGCRR